MGAQVLRWVLGSSERIRSYRRVSVELGPNARTRPRQPQLQYIEV